MCPRRQYRPGQSVRQTRKHRRLPNRADVGPIFPGMTALRTRNPLTASHLWRRSGVARAKTSPGRGGCGGFVQPHTKNAQHSRMRTPQEAPKSRKRRTRRTGDVSRLGFPVPSSQSLRTAGVDGKLVCDTIHYWSAAHCRWRFVEPAGWRSRLILDRRSHPWGSAVVRLPFSQGAGPQPRPKDARQSTQHRDHGSR